MGKMAGLPTRAFSFEGLGARWLEEEALGWEYMPSYSWVEQLRDLYASCRWLAEVARICCFWLVVHGRRKTGVGCERGGDGVLLSGGLSHCWCTWAAKCPPLLSFSVLGGLCWPRECSLAVVDFLHAGRKQARLTTSWSQHQDGVSHATCSMSVSTTNSLNLLWKASRTCTCTYTGTWIYSLLYTLV